MTSGYHIILAGGGTLGHLYPGLAIAQHLAERLPGTQITFVGSGKAIERHTVRAAGFQYTTLPARPTPRNPLEAFRFVTDNVAGFCAGQWMLREQRASLVLGLGGYISASLVHAARWRGVPIVLLEQDAIPHRTTRMLAHAAEAVCVGFESTQAQLSSGATIVTTGTPARPAFEQLYSQRFGSAPPNEVADLAISRSSGSGLKRLVVLGGAGPLNAAVPGALRQITSRLAGWRIVHQTGEGQLQETERRYQQAGIEALTVSYVDEMASLLFETDLVVCRAGGSTLAELALAGVPTVMLPAIHFDDDAQRANAQVISAAHAGTVVDESLAGDRLDEALAREIDLLVTDHTRRQQMAANMLRLARPRAASDIADVCCEIVCGSLQRAAA
ncbi:MAG: UDP-N-acetylglucosamine--N-acetylmuramyl-(pentapeptide) pyrophosphoryl-undecaprenol N-acetylglucosamine transferase [Pirellulales bacterium]